jgi:spore maturation protein CgeB
MPETVRAVRAIGIPVFLFHADNPFPPFIGHRPETMPTLREVDYVFLWSRELCERLRNEGISRVDYLPFGWDEAVFPAGSDRGAGVDLLFIGGWDEERERVLEPLAQRFALQIWGPEYWGTRTGRRSPVRRCWQGRDARDQEASRLIRRAAITLNILRHQNLPDGTNMRTFEVPGCGGFLLSTRSTGATAIYPEGEAGAYFASIEECVEQVERWLGDPSGRLAIAERAQRITAASERYLDRAKRIVKVLDDLQAANVAIQTQRS